MMMKRTVLALTLATSAVAALALPATAEEQVAPPRLSWSFAGPFGKYDPAQLQRGFKIYREVCSACHSIQMLAFRNLADPGGPGFSEAQAAAVAAEFKVKDLDDQGNPIERPGRPADTFPPPFANELAAKAANGGTAPPDMSTLAKARTYSRGFPWFIFDAFTQYQEHGPDYIAALLKGYEDPPKGFQLPQGGNYNRYFPGHNIAMPPPLADGRVTYADGTKATLQQEARDVATFLAWAAEPKLEDRHRIGARVVIFLLAFSGVMYGVKRKIWANVHH